MKQKLKAKDLVSIGLLSLLEVVLMYTTPLPFILNPYGLLITPLIHAVVLALVYFLIGAKVQKAGAILIFSTILGLSGMALYYIVSLIVAGIIGEMILKKTGYGDKKGLTIGYMVFAFLNAFALMIPYMFFAETTYANIVRIYGAEYADKAIEVRTMPIMIVLLVVIIIAAFIGAYFSKKILKKHFEKANIV